MKTIEERYECDVCNMDDLYESEVNVIVFKVKYSGEEVTYKKHLCQDCMIDFEKKFDL